SDAVTYDVELDEEGSAWVATEAGLDRLRRAPFALLDPSHGLPFDTPHWISPDASGAIWALSLRGARIYQIDGGIIRGEPGRVKFWSPRDTSARDYGPFATARAGGVWTYDQRARAVTRVVADRESP